MTRKLADTFTVGLVQMHCDPEPESNLARTVSAVRRAADSGAQIVCLQELFRSPYFCQRQDPALFDLAEPIPGPSSEQLAKVARETETVVIASLFEKRAPGVYHNTAAVFDADGSLCGLYRKMHIPDDPLYFEKYYFTPGDLGFKAFDTTLWQGGRAGVLGPVVSRSGAADGLAGSGDPGLSDCHWLASGGKGRARQGAACSVGVDAARPRHRQRRLRGGVNRVGHEGPLTSGLEFWGASFVADPFGVVLGGRRTRRRRCWWCPATAAAWRTSAATGRSCATAASTPTATSLSVCSTDRQ